MRVGHIELFVRDPLASKAFYADVLGGEVVAVQGDQFVWIKLGEVELLLRPGVPGRPTSAYADAASGIVLYTDDLPAQVRELRSRGLAFAGTEGSDDCLTFADPDGHWFMLVDPSSHG
jgi:catechol 2,3-dioxygenase-like lactoylglutathione lyase family enzyme